jgi:chromatin segregation and condensation protein Rec8/ScpA/Scc1 (kleisin family)
MSDDEDPFWTAPPYILLTDVLKLDQIEPWNVRAGEILVGFLEEMKRLGDIDFRISGNALYSASVLFMKKTRELVELGILPPEEDDEEGELEIPLILPPFRLTNRRVILQELLVAMDRVLSKGVRRRAVPRKRSQRIHAEPITFTMETERAQVEETISEVYGDLCEILKIDETVKFVDILINRSRREIVRVFFSLLHLYARAYVDIWMDDESTIWVKLVVPPDDGRPVKVVQKKLTG